MTRIIRMIRMIRTRMIMIRMIKIRIIRISITRIQITRTKMITVQIKSVRIRIRISTRIRKDQPSNEEAVTWKGGRDCCV